MSLTADDKLAILELLSRASYGYDERKLDMLEACYTPDASFIIHVAGAGEPLGPFEGIDALMELYRSSLESQSDVRRHVLSNTFFDTEGGDPVAVSNLTLFATENGKVQLLCTGVYRDQVTRTEAGWRILRRRLDLDSSH